MHCTPVETRRARKDRRCDYCGELILVGEQYEHWMCFAGYDTGASDVHPECGEAIRDEGEDFERYQHDRPTREP